MLIRIRAKDGQFRCEVQPGDDASKLLEQILASTKADAETLTLSDAPHSPGRSASELRDQSIASLGLRHGDMLFASYQDKQEEASTSQSSAPVSEDAVDVYWSQQRGLIPRQHDRQFCRHGEKGMCDYCMPIEPYDMTYHAQHGIKHLSFHAYLRQQNIGVPSASTSYVPPLEELSYRVKVPCPSGQHESWPASICTKCQPSAITLQRQKYRMVDHVEFVHSALIDRMLDAWRKTATQRFGYLLGHYEPYDKVPMGIKAVVEAIHEPPQAGETDGIVLGMPWDDEARIQELAEWCGLCVVGMIYTDLEVADPTHSDPTQAGLVSCKRHADSFFLSGQEALFAAQQQSQHKNACRWSQSGLFNSKFVTCVLSGNPMGEIDVSAYQVSEQVMAMVDADMIEASVHPTTIRVKPSDSTRYVPDVFYRYTNKYGIDVKENASPTFPVEYLLVTCTHGFPTEPKPRFLSSAFAIENRPGLEDQTLDGLLAEVRNVTPDTLVSWLSDWHLLAFLGQTGFFSPDDMRIACRVAVTHRGQEALMSSSGWQTLVTIAQESAPQPSPPPPPPAEAEPEALADAPSEGSACPHCTFLNAPGSTDCDVCGLPLH